jgi:hypothetical protein
VSPVATTFSADDTTAGPSGMIETTALTKNVTLNPPVSVIAELR